jgi:hypothetical protein
VYINKARKHINKYIYIRKMRISASIHVMGALAFMSLMNCQAFTPAKISSLSSTSPSFGIKLSEPMNNVATSSTSLNMGVMEDFLAGTDKETRKKENEAYLKTLDARVERINAMEPAIEDLEDDELVAKTKEFRKRLVEDGEDINGPILEEAFAVVREAAWYVLVFMSVLMHIDMFLFICAYQYLLSCVLFHHIYPIFTY